MFKEIIPGVISNLISGIIGLTLGTIYSNRKILKLYFQSLKRFGKKLRLSTAYLFRIKDENKYVLIKGNRIEQYQPVGGVYKYYDSFNKKKKEMKLVDEKEGRFFEIKDLRQKTKGQYLAAYIK